MEFVPITFRAAQKRKAGAEQILSVSGFDRLSVYFPTACLLNKLEVINKVNTVYLGELDRIFLLGSVFSSGRVWIRF